MKITQDFPNLRFNNTLMYLHCAYLRKRKKRQMNGGLLSWLPMQNELSRKQVNQLPHKQTHFCLFSHILYCNMYLSKYTLFYADLLKIFSNLFTLEIDISRVSWKRVLCKGVLLSPFYFYAFCLFLTFI